MTLYLHIPIALFSTVTHICPEFKTYKHIQRNMILLKSTIKSKKSIFTTKESCVNMRNYSSKSNKFSYYYTLDKQIIEEFLISAGTSDTKKGTNKKSHYLFLYNWKGYEFTDSQTWDDISKDLFWFCHRTVVVNSELILINKIKSRYIKYITNNKLTDKQLEGYAIYISLVLLAKANIIIKYCYKYKTDNYTKQEKILKNNKTYEDEYISIRRKLFIKHQILLNNVFINHLNN